jgi:hypothetical protein
MPQIEVEQISDHAWRARIEGSHLTDVGKTIEEALGNLVNAFPCSLGLTITIVALKADVAPKFHVVHPMPDDDAELQAAARAYQIP